MSQRKRSIVLYCLPGSLEMMMDLLKEARASGAFYSTPQWDAKSPDEWYRLNNALVFDGASVMGHRVDRMEDYPEDFYVQLKVGQFVALLDRLKAEGGHNDGN